MTSYFEWDNFKDRQNQEKHGVSFETAKRAFYDRFRILAVDTTHSETEKRYHCYGKVDGRVLTVRFTLRNRIIRIFGAAYWRKGVKIYDQENSL